MAKKAGIRRGIQSVVIGMRVLASVAANRKPSSLTAISEASGLSASQAHRYLGSLMKSGMVKQDERLGLYDLDAGAIRLGLAALSRLDVFHLADITLPDLVDDTGYTCLVAIWGDSGATIVRWYAGTPPLITSMSLGSVLPLLTSATGQIFYAFGEEGLTAEMAIQESKAASTDLAEFEAQRKRTRSRLYAQVKGKFVPGLRAVSAPVFDVQGRLAISVTLVASDAIPKNKDTGARTALVDSCAQMTESMGGKWPSA